MKYFEVRDPKGTLRFASLSEEEAKTFASDLYKYAKKKGHEVICQIYEINKG